MERVQRVERVKREFTLSPLEYATTSVPENSMKDGITQRGWRERLKRLYLFPL
jgi:hypothetical protein